MYFYMLTCVKCLFCNPRISLILFVLNTWLMDMFWLWSIKGGHLKCFLLVILPIELIFLQRRLWSSLSEKVLCQRQACPSLNSWKTTCTPRYVRLRGVWRVWFFIHFLYFKSISCKPPRTWCLNPSDLFLFYRHVLLL